MKTTFKDLLGGLLIISASFCLVLSSRCLWDVGDKPLVILAALIWGCTLTEFFGAAAARIVTRTILARLDWFYWRMLHFGNVIALQWRVVIGVTLIMGVMTTAASFAVRPIYSSTCIVRMESDVLDLRPTNDSSWQYSY